MNDKPNGHIDLDAIEEGFAADFAAALTRVVEDPERARAMGEAGRARAIEHFSWETIAERTIEVYEAVLR